MAALQGYWIACHQNNVKKLLTNKSKNVNYIDTNLFNRVE